MGRNTQNIYKKLDKSDLFIMGENPKERAKILYIRGGIKPSQVIKLLREYGDDEIPAKRLTEWINSEKWQDLRKKFSETYDVTVAVKRAEVAAEKDTTNEEHVREVYANVSGDIMNMIAQKIKFNKPPYAEAAIMHPRDIKDLAETTKTMQDVHFRALGLPELAFVDPTQGHEGITILTANDMKKLDTKKKA